MPWRDLRKCATHLVVHSQVQRANMAARGIVQNNLVHMGTGDLVPDVRPERVEGPGAIVDVWLVALNVCSKKAKPKRKVCGCSD